MQKEKLNYADLAKPTSLHRFILYTLIIVGFFLSYLFLISLVRYFVEHNLNGKIYNKTELRGQTKEDDKLLQRLLNNDKLKKEDWKKLREVSFWGNWAVDLHTPTSMEPDSRYWFQPLFSFSSISFICSLFFATLATSLMPVSIGYFRQKIEREIIASLSNIHLILYGIRCETYDTNIANQIIDADVNQLRELSQLWRIQIDDFIVLRQALIWRNKNFKYKLFHPLEGLRLYLRNHFTEKYGNTILGFVYIGAAFLIIIIGLRGLKFIPASEPSLVFFALGLEFSILITYAFTLMFARPDEQQEFIDMNSPDKKTIANRQMENLLRSFIKWKQ